MSKPTHLAQEIEQRYNAHLRELGDEAAQLQQWLLDQERERGVVFGGNPVPTMARPVFLSASQNHTVEEACNCVMGCIEKILERYFHDPQIQAMVGLPEAEDRLARIDPRIQPRVPNVRLDAFHQGEDLKFLEFNAGTGRFSKAHRFCPRDQHQQCLFRILQRRNHLLVQRFLIAQARHRTQARAACLIGGDKIIPG